MNIINSDLTTRLNFKLIRNNIKSLEQLSSFSEDELLKFYGIGNTSVSSIKKELWKYGLSLKPNDIVEIKLEEKEKLNIIKKLTLISRADLESIIKEVNIKRNAL